TNEPESQVVSSRQPEVLFVLNHDFDEGAEDDELDLGLKRPFRPVTKDLAPRTARSLVSTARPLPDYKSEERLIPMIRARLAERLIKEGFRPKEAAAALNVTQAAVTQYLKRKRGGNAPALASIDHLVDPLAEKLARRMRSGL